MNNKIIKFFNANANDYKNKYYSKNIFHNYFFNSRLDKIISKLDNFYENILDIGHGTGDIYEALKLHNVKFNNFYCTDISSKMLEKSKIDYDNKFCGNVWDSKFNVNEYNLILMIGVSSYMNSQTLKKNLEFISRNTKKNAYFVITINNKKSLDLFFRKLFKFFFSFLLPSNSVLKNFTPYVYNYKYIYDLLNNKDSQFKLFKIEKHNFTIFPFNLIFPKTSIYLGEKFQKINLKFLHSDEILIFKKNG